MRDSNGLGHLCSDMEMKTWLDVVKHIIYSFSCLIEDVSTTQFSQGESTSTYLIVAAFWLIFDKEPDGTSPQHGQQGMSARKAPL